MNEIAMMVSYLRVGEILVILLTPPAIVAGSYLLFRVGALGPDLAPEN
ncbi:MAG TPA: hypothetical protein VFG68_10215 [Fimbriiglobus sp.]|nr:hypothetical protein [Fimbriiglobus sp.]